MARRTWRRICIVTYVAAVPVVVLWFSNGPVPAWIGIAATLAAVAATILYPSKDYDKPVSDKS